MLRTDSQRTFCIRSRSLGVCKSTLKTTGILPGKAIQCILPKAVSSPHAIPNHKIKPPLIIKFQVQQHQVRRSLHLQFFGAIRNGLCDFLQDILGQGTVRKALRVASTPRSCQIATHLGRRETSPGFSVHLSLRIAPKKLAKVLSLLEVFTEVDNSDTWR